MPHRPRSWPRPGEEGPAALAEYEAAMVPRAAAAAGESAANPEIAFRADAPGGMIEVITGHA